MTVTMDACGQEKKTGGMGEDSFKLVMYFKHMLIFLNNSNSNNKDAACEHPELSHSPSSGHFFSTVPGSWERKGNGTHLGPFLLKGRMGRDCWVINSHFTAQWNQSRKAMARQAQADFSLATPRSSRGDLTIPKENSLLISHDATDQMPWWRITFAGLVASLSHNATVA